MSKKKLYMVSLSDGKDSTAMLLRLIEEKRPIDLILFCDTGLEFPQMYDHLKKLEQYIGSWCTGLLKTRVVQNYLKELKEDFEVVEYIGIAADEPKRIKNGCYPLVEWEMTEKDCLAYCYAKGFDWGGLYEIFHRVSCWCCPLQALFELRKLYEHFPELWAQLRRWDDSTWRQFRADYSVRELESRFAFEKEWSLEGKSIRSRAFYNALKQKLTSVRR